MKKILIGVLIVLLIVMAYFAIFKGISLGSFQILSVNQIQKENESLTQSIKQTESLMHSDYPTKTDELEKSISSLLAAKEEYLDLANVSTDAEISQATKEETYKVEYLWARIGSHATGEGVLLTLAFNSGDTGGADTKNLSFNITGNYYAIINFISALEDDSKLGFRIENFKMLPGSDPNARQATFVVRNVKVKLENTTSNVSGADAGTNATPTPNPTGNTVPEQ